MTEYLLRLRSGAAVRRQVLNCEPDPLVLSGDHDDVGRWFADGEVAATVFAKASLHGDGFALVTAPNGDFVWLPSEALTQSEFDDAVELVEMLPACGTRTAVQWQAATLPSDTDWLQVHAEGDRVLFRRWDETRQVSYGATHSASACDVLAKTPIELTHRNRCPSVLAANERALQALPDDASVVAQLLASFMHRSFGDAWPGQLHLAADSLRLFARIHMDGEVPEVEPVLQDGAQRATKPEAIDHDTAANVCVSPMRSNRAAEPERRSFDKQARVRDIPETNTECSSAERDQPIPVQHRFERSIPSVVTNVRGDRRATATTSDPAQEASKNGLPSGEVSLATAERRPELGNAKQALLSSAGESQRTAGADPDATLAAAPPEMEVELQDNPHHPSDQRPLASAATGDLAKPDRANQPLQTTRNSHRGSTGTIPVSDPQLLGYAQTRAGALERPGVIPAGNDAVLARTVESNTNGAWKARLSSSSRDRLGVGLPTAESSNSQSRVAGESHQLVVADQALNPQSLERPAKNRYAETLQTQEVLLAEQSGDTEGIEGGVHNVTSSPAPVNEASSRVVRRSAALIPTPCDVVQPLPDANDSRTGISRLGTPRLDATRLDATRLDASRLDASRLDAPRLDATRLDATRLDATRLDATRLDATRLDATRLDATRLDASRLDAPRLDAPRLDSARVESPRIDSSRTESSRAELAGPESDEVITHAKPAVSGLSRRPFSEVKALNAFAQIARTDARQPLNSQGADTRVDSLQASLNVEANTGTSTFLATEQVQRTRQLPAAYRPRSHLTFGAPSSERLDSTTRKPGTAEYAIAAPRALKVISTGMQHRAARQSLEPSVRTRTAAVETRIHGGAPPSGFSIERSIEIGEIVVEIGDPESPILRNVTTPAGSLIARIPESRLGARR